MGIHIRPQDRIDAGLITAPTAKPRQQIGIDPHRDRLLAARHHNAGLLPHNNQVLIVGGTAGADGAAVTTAEIYVEWQGTNGSFYPTNMPGAARAWATCCLGAGTGSRPPCSMRTRPLHSSA